MKHFIDKNSVSIFTNQKLERDMAFPTPENFHGEMAIFEIVNDVYKYLFKQTDFFPICDSHISYLVACKYPINYKGLVGTAYWGEDDYNKELARIRLYRKVREMSKKFADDIYEYLIHGENSLFNKAKNNYVNTFMFDKPSNKVKYIRNRFFKNINYDIDEEKKIVVAYFGENKKESRNYFALIAINTVYASFLRQMRQIYKEDAFVDEKHISRKFVGVAKYNKDKETEPFSIEKGKELAKADLIKRYMLFEKKVAEDNFKQLLANVEQVQKQYNKFNIKKK